MGDDGADVSPVTWVFHSSRGRGHMLRVLVERYVHDLRLLLPEVGLDNPLEALAAEMEAGERVAQTVDEQPDFHRFFPPALRDVGAAQDFRAKAVAGQARTRIEAAETVLADLGTTERRRIGVPAGHIDAWVQVLAALRAQWYVELTGSGDRLVEPTEAQLEESPETAALLDWLAILIEDALLTKRGERPVG